MIQVTLSPEEWSAAEAIGQKREDLAKERQRSVEYKDNGGTADERHRVGAVAEYALAVHLGPDILDDWLKTKAFSLNHQTIKCDVGTNLHVRSSSNPKASRLILHPYDPDEGVFVFAKIEPVSRTVTFHGWLYAREGKLPGYWNNTLPGFNRPGRAAYAIHYRHLNGMENLPPEAVR